MALGVSLRWAIVAIAGALAACGGAEPAPFGDRVLRGEPVVVDAEPLALVLPEGGIRSGGGFDALCLTLGAGWSLGTRPGAAGCVLENAAAEQVTLTARFALDGGSFTPRTCHQSTVITAGQPQARICLRNPGVPDPEFVYTGIAVSASAPVPVTRIDWRDAPGGAGGPGVWQR